MRLLFPAAAAVLSFTLANAQECDNFGQAKDGTCYCPAGLTGSNCSQPVHGGDLYAPKPDGQCSDGWFGPTCTVCTSDDACQNALSTIASPGNGTPMPGMNETLVCNTQPVIYSTSHMECDVVQSMLQAVFPGETRVTITRFMNGSSSPGGDATYTKTKQASGVNEGFMQLWYNGQLQASCHLTQCNQTVLDGNSNWHCPGLKCHCLPGTTFCGADGKSGGNDQVSSIVGSLGLNENTLTGPVDINCKPNGDCSFKQKFLNMLGAEGLPLKGCKMGECVNQYVIDQALGITHVHSDNGLSGGVIAGLAVVGAFALLAAIVTVWGLLKRRKARKAPAGSLYKHGGVSVTWSGVGYQVRGYNKRGWYNRIVGWLRGFGDVATSRPGSPNGEEGTGNSDVVLHDACGELPAGGFCAVLGPSGAGKSTLVDILAGKRKSGQVSGRVSFHSNGGPVKVGYCDQSDVLSPTSTVMETLLFAAYLRLPENVPKAVKAARATTVLRQLSLEHIANTRVGSGLQRGISGGEMRRVSIAIELVANPDVLILDEPTSGLDSVSAARVVALLKSLTTDPENRTTIIASIHQPSSALYHSFSQVILLSRGKQLYMGPGGNAPADYFGAQGYVCPPGYNIADHLLDIASEAPSGLPSGHEAMMSTDMLPESLMEKASDSVVDLAVLNSTAPAKQKCATTFLTQFEVLSSREWRNLKRDKTLFVAHFLLFSVVGLFAGGLYFQVDLTIAGFQNRVGSLFFLGTLIAFSSLSALYNIVEIRPLFLRERGSSFYSPQAWLLARVIFDVIPLRLVPTIVLGVIIYFMVGLALSAARFFKFLLILVLYTLTMTLYNFLLGALFEHPSLAILLSSLWNLFNMTYAGFFINIAKIPAVLGWLHYLAPLNYALEAIVVNEVGSGLHIQDVLNGVSLDVAATLIMETLFGFNVRNYYRNVLVLFGWIAGFGLLLVATVFWVLREKR